MSFTRRTACGFTLLATLLAALPAFAQDYPNRPIRIILGFAPGGGNDSFTRIVATALTERIGHPVVVENKPGGGGMVAADFVAKAAPDGYTLLSADIGANAIAASLYPRLPYDPQKDFVPIVQAVWINCVLVVPANSSANNLQEFIALAKQTPGKLNYASAGIGGFSHLAAEMFKLSTQTDIVHVPYKGGAPGIAGLLGGEVQMMVTSVAAARPHIAAGKLKALVVTGVARSTQLPDVPTFAEAGVQDLTTDSWGGFMAPRGTPPQIITKLSAELNRVLQDPDVKAALTSMGLTSVGGGPEVFTRFVDSEIVRWRKVVREADVRPE